MRLFFKNIHFIILLSFVNFIYSDNFQYNSFNNHGALGLINTPSARFYNEGNYGLTFYKGTPDQKITLTSSPFDWLEASFFYTNIKNRTYCYNAGDPVCDQSYKDKGFNFKIRLKEEGVFPAIAIGLNDIAGTGFYSSEYIVGSYGIGNLDMHFGLGWGTLNGSDQNFKNPLIYINDQFQDRPRNTLGAGGQLQFSRYFSDKSVSPFYGISYVINDKFLFKAEHDPTKYDGRLDYEVPNNRLSFGFEYNINENFTIGLSQERGNYYSLRFSYKADASQANKKPYEYQKVEDDDNLNEYGNLINRLEANGIGVNKIVERADSVGIELTQFTHPGIDIVEEILMIAKRDSGITKEIKTDMRIANLQAYSDFDDDLLETSRLIYAKEERNSFNTSNRITIRPFLAAREGFFKFAILAQNDSEYIIKDNLIFSSNIKYSIKDNFDDLNLPPKDLYLDQVRSDVKSYMRNFGNRFIIGRAQLDYHYTPKKNNHLMFTAGILEEMFSGYGFEYLYFDNKKSYGIGVEAFHTKKRDYEIRFGTLDYENTTGFINLYYRNYNFIPFDAKVSYGKYLAGDVGATFELSRSYRNGAKFGIFATFTDVSREQFGEGSFDKGIFFNVPIYKDFLNYTWRPLTKDPGAKLNRKYTLYDLLIKFKPYND